VARSSYDVYHHLSTSDFVDDVMFSHNGANGPESKTVSMFRRVRQVTALGTKFDECKLSINPSPTVRPSQLIPAMSSSFLLPTTLMVQVEHSARCPDNYFLSQITSDLDI